MNDNSDSDSRITVPVGRKVTGGAKLHALIQELRGDAADALHRAEAIERAWSEKDFKELVSLGALTKLEAQNEDKRLENACDECLEPINPFKRGFINLTTGEKYHDRCCPATLQDEFVLEA